VNFLNCVIFVVLLLLTNWNPKNFWKNFFYSWGAFFSFFFLLQMQMLLMHDKSLIQAQRESQKRLEQEIFLSEQKQKIVGYILHEGEQQKITKNMIFFKKKIRWVSFTFILLFWFSFSRIIILIVKQARSCLHDFFKIFFYILFHFIFALFFSSESD
jgi:hypothetical protein